MKPSNQLRMNSSLASSDVIVLGRITGVVSQMAILDTHWTSAAGKLSANNNKKETDELGAVVRALEDVLVRSQPDFASLSEIFRANEDRLREGYDAVREGKVTGVRQPPKAQLDGFVDLVDRFGGDLANAAIDAARRLASPERIAAERKNLNDEFGKLSAGGMSGGDLSDEQWMDVHLIAMGAAIVLGAEAGAVVEAAAALWELIFG